MSDAILYIFDGPWRLEEKYPKITLFTTEKLFFSQRSLPMCFVHNKKKKGNELKGYLVWLTHPIYFIPINKIQQWKLAVSFIFPYFVILLFLYFSSHSFSFITISVTILILLLFLRYCYATLIPFNSRQFSPNANFTDFSLLNEHKNWI